MMKKTLAFLFISSVILLQLACPIKPVDPGKYKSGLDIAFSLFAPETDGFIRFQPSLYRTSGSFRLVQFKDTGLFDQKLTWTRVGSQIQYVKSVNANGTFNWRPKWVISATKSKTDVQNKRNIIIISILPAFDNNQASQNCDNVDDFTASNFCDNILSSGVFKVNATKNAYSYESVKYAQCISLTGKCNDGINTYPFYVSGSFADAPLDAQAEANIQTGALGNINKEYYYNSKNAADNGTNVATHLVKRYDVVIEYIDNNSQLFTTKFPYNQDLDNLGNHTPAFLKIANFPDPKLDAKNFIANVPAGAEHDTQYIRTDHQTDGSTDTANCVGLQSGPSGNELTCDKVVNGIAATIATTSTRDDDIIHKMQQAGKEFRAKGTDIEPRLEMILRGIQFDIQRGEDRFIQ